MEVRRGDVVVCAVTGDYGKPRPAVVIQSDLFNSTHASVTICPITTHLVDAPLFRPMVRPTAGNGLREASQVMVDKMTAVKREKIGSRIGALNSVEIARVDAALRVWLELDGSSLPG